MKSQMILVAVLLSPLVACQGWTNPSDTTALNPEESTAQPQSLENNESQTNRPTRDERAEQWDAQYASESRDSGWATRTESIVNGRVEEYGGTIETPLVCKTTICRGRFSFPNTTAQNQAIMGMEFSQALGYPSQRFVMPVPSTSSIQYYLRNSSQDKPSSPPGNRPPSLPDAD